MAAFSVLYPQLRIQCKWAPDPTLDVALKWAVRRFCAESRFLRETILKDAVAYQESYTLTSAQTGYEVFGVKAVTYDDEALTPGQIEDEKRTYGDPIHYFFRPTNELLLSPVPNESLDDGIEVTAYIQPTTSSTVIHDQIMSKFDRTIVDGALSWLLALKDEPSFDPNRSLQKEVAFNSGIASARAQADMGHRTRAFRVVSHP